MPATTPSPLRDYQKTGVNWLRDHLKTHRAVMLADEMGLGKTLQALRAAELLDADRVLIVCPAGARRVWQQEIKRWLPGWFYRVVLIEPPASEIRQIPKRPLIAIVGYDELSNLKSLLAVELGRRRWDLLILDEAHYLKNPSNRTLALYGRRGGDEGIQHSAARVILLTGTPTPNHAGELWQHVRTFWPTLVPGGSTSQTAFEDAFTRYKDTVFGRQVVGSKNQQILRQALAPVVLRRRKDEVLTELPPLVLQDVPLLGGPPNWIGSFRPENRVTAAKLNFHAEHATDDELIQALRNPDAPVATLRRELGLLKLAPTLAWIRERLASTDKLLVFAWHHEVIEGLRRQLLEFAPVVLTGKSSPAERALAVQDFQTCPETRIFLGQILAAGTAITLTAANEVAIVEPSWVPGENIQAICRAHRLGQRDSVLASFLFLPGTLDERIMRVFRRKAAEISVLAGDDQNASAA